MLQAIGIAAKGKSFCFSSAVYFCCISPAPIADGYGDADAQTVELKHHREGLGGFFSSGWPGSRCRDAWMPVCWQVGDAQQFF